MFVGNLTNVKKSLALMLTLLLFASFAFVPANVEADAIKVACIGDSITLWIQYRPGL